MFTTHLHRRQFVLAAASFGLAPVLANPDLLPLKIVSPYPAGGSVDFWARALKQELEASHGFSVQAINQPGASGVLAANQIQSTPQASTPTLLLAGTALFSMIPLLPDANLNFDPNEVFTPLAILWEEPFFVAVRSDSPFQSFEDLMARARNGKTPISLGSTGTQSIGGLFFEHFAKTQRLDISHVPFKGMTEVVANLLGRHIDVGVLSYQQAKAHVEAKTFKLLATTGDSRSELAPLVPTMKELKKSNLSCTVWFGLFVKKTTEPETVKRLQTALRRVLDNAGFRTTMTTNGYSVLALTGNDAANYVQHSNTNWTHLIPR